MTPRVVDERLLADWPLPEPGTHKNARGSVAVAGGGATTPGSVRLAGEAALRVGAGKLRIATVEAAQLAVAIPEAAVGGFPSTGSGDLAAEAAKEIAEFAARADVVLVGSGLVDPDDAERLTAALVPLVDAHLVVDALGSAYVGHDNGTLAGRCVLNVNPNELGHVLELSADEVSEDPERRSAEAAERFGLVVACGGEQKVVATPEGDVYVVPGGGPGLAVSGSGDVHAGLVAGLLARTGNPAQSAVWAGWLHATAGDRLAATVGEVGFLARELLPLVPQLLSQPFSPTD